MPARPWPSAARRESWTGGDENLNDAIEKHGAGRLRRLPRPWTVCARRRVGALDLGGDGTDNAFAGILDPGDHAGVKLQHFAELGSDDDKALAQRGRRCLGDARIKALGFAAVKRRQFLDLGIVGLERGGAAVFSSAISLSRATIRRSAMAIRRSMRGVSSILVGIFATLISPRPPDA